MSLYKETLMKHFRNPEYKFEMEGYTGSADGVNPSCGDNITLFCDQKDGNISKLSFTGNGCAISMASADIMCSVLPHVEFPVETIENFLSMLEGQDITFSGVSEVLNVFREMQSYPARQSCAILPWRTVKEFL